jgi:hypothetical protein
LFEIERSINGKTPAERIAVRQERAKPLVDDLKGLDAPSSVIAWLRATISPRPSITYLAAGSP